jgi:hypothetical protein
MTFSIRTRDEKGHGAGDPLGSKQGRAWDKAQARARSSGKEPPTFASFASKGKPCEHCGGKGSHAPICPKGKKNPKFSGSGKTGKESGWAAWKAKKGK